MRSFLAVKRLALPVAVTAVWLASCTAVENDNTTNTIVQIVSMQAVSADQTGTPGADLFSDVCSAGSAPPSCTAVNDFGIVTMIANRKDQIRDITQFGDVIFTRYRVTYVRADGRNVPGVEVPYAFDGAANFRVATGGDSTTRTFTVVRQQAKLEPPLSNLRFKGGAIVFSVLAQIDFFGTDVAGRAITVRGFLNISFADF